MALGVISLLIVGNGEVADENYGKNGSCTLAVSGIKVRYFFDSEALYNGLHKDVIQEVANSAGGSEHCDAIVVTDSKIYIYELSANKGRSVEEYLKKFEWCLAFLKYFNEKVSDIGLDRNEIHLVIVTTPDAYDKLNDEMKYTNNAQKRFKMGVFSRYINRLQRYVKLCKTVNKT